jgi:2-C-methyl-D-erythritol 4-phosphate cytidylyltransferase
VRAVVSGGLTRTESVRNATAALPADTEVVIVHDIARPLVPLPQFDRLITAIAEGADCAVPAWPLPDTLKFLHPDGSIEHRGREGLVVAQSPMAFAAAILHQVFATFDEIPIEESIAVEQLGGRVVTVPGDPWSHHVVEPRDLAVMAQLLAGVPAHQDTSTTSDISAGVQV